MIRIKEAKELWLQVLTDKKAALGRNSTTILKRLESVSFLPGGEIKSNRYGQYVSKHYPALVQEYQERLEKKQQGELFFNI